MFRKKTVLIVGAGASKDFDFPLGPDLLDLFSKRIVQGKQDYLTRGGMFGGISGKELLLHRYRLIYQFIQNKNVELPFDSVGLDKFQQAINGQTISSIDRFLRDHAEYSEIGRFLIALEIVARSYSREDENGERHLRDFSTGPSTEWIATLINELREGAANANELKKNKLTIINFNYDTMIERALDAQFSKTSRHNGADWKDSVRMFHVYGRIANLEPRLVWSNFFPQVLKSANLLSYIHSEQDTVEFTTNLSACKQALIESDKVASIGFAFDEANIAPLALGENNTAEKIFALNYDGSVGLNNRLRNLGVKNVFQPSGGDKVMTIKQALEYGLIP